MQGKAPDLHGFSGRSGALAFCPSRLGGRPGAFHPIARLRVPATREWRGSQVGSRSGSESNQDCITAPRGRSGTYRFTRHLFLGVQDLEFRIPSPSGNAEPGDDMPSKSGPLRPQLPIYSARSTDLLGMFAEVIHRGVPIDSACSGSQLPIYSAETTDLLGKTYRFHRQKLPNYSEC